MRKTLINTLVCGTLAVAGTAHAGLVFDLNGAAAGGLINADSFDWAPTSFLAMGGNAAVASYAADYADNGKIDAVHSFDVLVHARMTGYKDANTGMDVGINRSDEITLVGRYTEVVAGLGGVPGLVSTAYFQSTGNGWLDMYYGANKNGNDLTGSGFDDGTLIMKAAGVAAGVFGTFTVDLTKAPVALDNFGGNDYPGQQTVTGSGGNNNLQVGTTSMALDGNFFQSGLAGFALNFANISQGLPFISVNPSDCFNPTAAGNAVGTDDGLSQCTNNHVVGTYAAQGPDGGYNPITGLVNGSSNNGSPDFVAQTDFNTPVSAVPVPGAVWLLGSGLLGLAGIARKRKIA